MSGSTVISFFAILISGAAFINAFSFPGGTSDGVPGAGVFPQAVCVIIALINAFLIIDGLRKRHDPEPMSRERREGLVRMLALAAVTVVFLALWQFIHFAVAASLYMTAVGFILKQNLKTFIPGSIAGSILVYIIFQHILNVMLNT